VLRAPVAAVSVGLVAHVPLLDLCYTEDRDAQVDLNVVGASDGGLVEVQGTAEDAPMTRAEHDTLLSLALGGLPALFAAQRAALTRVGVDLDALLG
jgi:ribonuclease PH